MGGRGRRRAARSGFRHRRCGRDLDPGRGGGRTRRRSRHREPGGEHHHQPSPAESSVLHRHPRLRDPVHLGPEHGDRGPHRGAGRIHHRRRHERPGPQSNQGPVRERRARPLHHRPTRAVGPTPAVLDPVSPAGLPEHGRHRAWDPGAGLVPHRDDPGRRLEAALRDDPRRARHAGLVQTGPERRDQRGAAPREHDRVGSRARTGIRRRSERRVRAAPPRRRHRHGPARADPAPRSARVAPAPQREPDAARDPVALGLRPLRARTASAGSTRSSTALWRRSIPRAGWSGRGG